MSATTAPLDVLQTLANSLYRCQENCDRLRAEKPFTPHEYTSVALRLSATLGEIEEISLVWETLTGAEPTTSDVYAYKTR